jgi:hypothetical protein
MKRERKGIVFRWYPKKGISEAERASKTMMKTFCECELCDRPSGFPLTEDKVYERERREANFRNSRRLILEVIFVLICQIAVDYDHNAE